MPLSDATVRCQCQLPMSDANNAIRNKQSSLSQRKSYLVVRYVVQPCHKRVNLLGSHDGLSRGCLMCEVRRCTLACPRALQFLDTTSHVSVPASSNTHRTTNTQHPPTHRNINKRKLSSRKTNGLCHTHTPPHTHTPNNRYYSNTTFP